MSTQILLTEDYKKLCRIEFLVKDLFVLLDKNPKKRGKEHPTVAELRKLVGA